MKREGFVADIGDPGRIVHVVGRITDEVFGFLGPATAVLADHGAQQTIILIDDARYRGLLTRFDARIELIVNDGEAGALRAWRAALAALNETLRGGRVRALHLHGAVAYLASGFLMRRRPPDLAPDLALYYSPYRPDRHGLGYALTRAVLRMLIVLVTPLRFRAIATVDTQADALRRATPPKIDLIERPLAPEFLAVRRRESRRPLLVGGHPERDVRSLERFARLAVLLSGAPLQLSFNWVGPADALSERRLNAAGVGVWPLGEPDERARRLAAGWVFLAPLSGTAVAPIVIEAMAAGVPVVALDVPHYRDLIQDGETGFLCGTEEQTLDRVAWLIDRPMLRLQIGQAARAATRQRFGEQRFSDSVLAAYSLTAPRPLDEISP